MTENPVEYRFLKALTIFTAFNILAVGIGVVIIAKYDTGLGILFIISALVLGPLIVQERYLRRGS